MKLGNSTKKRTAKFGSSWGQPLSTEVRLSDKQGCTVEGIQEGSSSFLAPYLRAAFREESDGCGTATLDFKDPCLLNSVFSR